MRRLLGPVGGPIVFFLVAALVFAGLGWVTYTALNVEQDQRKAAAQAELGNNLRVALWRLDGRMLPALGVEDSRPFYHYSPADPSAGYAAVATPLLTATLPDWMQLHFQCDPSTGWESPQVLPPDVADSVRNIWPEVRFRNLNGSREAILNNELKAKFPVVPTCDLFAARDRAISEDMLPLAAPLIAGELNAAPATNPTPTSTPKPTQNPPSSPQVQNIANQGAEGLHCIRLFGWILGLPCEQVNSAGPGQEVVDATKKLEAPAPRPAQPPANNLAYRGSGRGGGQNDLESDRARNEFWNRALTTGKGIKEAQQSYDSQLLRNPYVQNSITPGEQRNSANLLQNGTNSNSIRKNEQNEAILPAVVGNTLGRGEKNSSGTTQAALFILRAGAGVIGQLADLLAMDSAEGLAQRKAWEFNSLKRDEGVLNSLRWFGASTPSQEGVVDRDNKPRDPSGSRPQSSNSGATIAPQTDPGVVQPVAQPTSPTVVGGITQPIAIHLGSMRPQWVTAPDGSELLFLVRTARYENKTVYQGVVLNWEKLQAALHDEVKDLFPQANLVPVRDPAGVSPDRAMTALPVQLDPGPEPALPPAGWTPLRMGLLLAWVAAIVAFAAVGFSGWSLIDLAERRMRFVSAVTHELRTPLTSLRLYLDLLVSGMIQDEEKRREYLSTLTVESDRLHRLIDNVLDFARLEKRARNGDIRPVPVGELVQQLGQTWADRVAQDGKELVVISTLPSEREIATDPAMIQQIVGNLIDNARKYTREAADRRIWLWAKPGPGNSVIIEVEDRGSGVAASERRAIFKPFRRGEHADGKAGGAGLGLALAKSWAEVLGARLSYRPAECGTGACFRLELPGN